MGLGKAIEKLGRKDAFSKNFQSGTSSGGILCTAGMVGSSTYTTEGLKVNFTIMNSCWIGV